MFVRYTLLQTVTMFVFAKLKKIILHLQIVGCHACTKFCMQSSNDSQITTISLTAKTIFQWPSSCESTFDKKKLHSALHTSFQDPT